jgi:hypothetical protein
MAGAGDIRAAAVRVLVVAVPTLDFRSNDGKEKNPHPQTVLGHDC